MTSNTRQQDLAVTDTARLATSAYADDQHLAARQSIYLWQKPRYDLPGIIVEHLAKTNGTILDVGCGNGKFITRIRQDRPDIKVIGLDISIGIITSVSHPVAVADAQALPVADASVDAVLAMHMLYHVPDIPAAIKEAARVLRPGGLVIASTNSENDKHELDQLWSAAAAEVLGTLEGPSRISLSSRFSLEKAPELFRNELVNIRVLKLPGVIELTDVAPAVAHFASYEAWADQLGTPFATTLQRASELAAAEITEHGSLRITCLGGIIIAQKANTDMGLNVTD
ncbi:class I SAM-dependent methyltransferase [Streptomyces botrytidirepellens]|uniref:Class I SAM-dependent methyltransferase n=1 Tax=Streptomyces botrytidirepellens TaxID=2486417 RepID=A0A3M8VJU7_9ACTN|nr:class I SAM-dependent methyltransferase [Streptomyces botrytidirepellens]RNG17854.1 class I SAM-dependent methyltransferase [Streptomyces botrytidirepellens]